MNATPQRRRPALAGPGAETNTQGNGRNHSTARNMLPPGSKFCLCAGCREFFTAPSAFDRHRVGKYEVTSGPDRRRCLTVNEMQLAGWRQLPDGYWTPFKERTL